MKKIEKSNHQITKKQKQNYLRNKLKSKKLISTLSAVVLVPLPLFSISANIEGKEDINSWGNIKLETLDNGSHNSTIYPKIAKAKSSAMKSIENVAMHSPLLNDVKISKFQNLNDFINVIAMNDDNKTDDSKEDNWSNKAYMHNIYSARGKKGVTKSKIIYENITSKPWTQKFKINFKQVKPSVAWHRFPYDIPSLRERIAKNIFSTDDHLFATLDSSTKNNQVIKRYKLKDAINKRYTIELVWVKKDEKWNIQYNFIQVDGDTRGNNDAIVVIAINEPSEAELLNELKNAAIAELEGLEYPNKDDKLHDATLFPAIDQAKTAAIKEIQAVTDYKEVDSVKLAQIDLINAAIDEYKKSTGTDKILADNKAEAIAAINAIDLPNKDDKLHDATQFPAIDQAKTAAIKAIQAVTEHLEVEGIKLAQIKLINDAIDAYNKSTGTDKILADNITAAIAELEGLEYPNKDDKLHDATLFPAIDQAKTAAIKAIQAVTDYKEVDGVKLAQIDLIKAAIDEYKKSTGTDKILADNKAAALAEINAINLPNKDDKLHDATLFPAIDQAKKTAIKAIETVTDYKKVEGIKTTQIDLIKKAIDEYNKSTGTDKILADNIAAAIAELEGLEYPNKDDKLHDATLFPAIDQAKTDAIKAIQAVTDYKEVDGVKLAQIDLIKAAIDEYNKSTGTDKILADNIAAAIAELEGLEYPNKDDKLHDATLFPAIDQAKTDAIKAIQAVTDYKEVDGVKLAQIDLIKAAIDEYKKSTGTDKILADNIAAAIAEINAIDLPNKDDKLHDATLFPAIDQAKTAAIKAIQAVTDYKEVAGVKSTQIDLIKKAIDAYNKSTLTDKILADNIAAAIAKLEGLEYPNKDDKLHDATLFPAIDQAKKTAIKAIEAVTDYKKVEGIKTTQIDLIKKAIDEYNKSTGTDKILADNIAAAIAEINAIDLPNKDDKLHDATLFPAIDQAKTAAIKAIQAVTDYKEVAGVKSTQIDLIKKAIDAYKKSNGIDKILADNNQNFFQKHKTLFIILISISSAITLGVASIIIRKIKFKN